VTTSNESAFAMKTRKSIVKLALLALLGSLAFASSQRLSAQEDKAADALRGREPDARGRASLVVAGYTRPGNPPDRARGGKIVPGGYLAGNPDFKGLGGTVFFAVFRLTNEDGDVWGTGVKDFDGTFVPGVDFNAADSPTLDTRAKYLYLYQVVNSRGLDPISKVIFAANKEKGTEAIASAAVRLRVDPRYITSWGHFKTTGLTLAVMPEDLEREKAAVGDKKPEAAKPAFAEDRDGAIRMAVSVNPAILGSLDSNAYLWRAPAHPLYRMRVDGSTLNLANSAAAKELEKRVRALRNNKERPAAWAEEMLKATKTANEPSLVRLVLSEPNAQLFLQADWSTKSHGLLNLADHSTVFGFTTDLPPVPEPVGIATPEGRADLLPVLDAVAAEAARMATGPDGEGVAPAVGDAGQGVAPGVAPAVAPGVAPGTAVGPIQAAAFAPTVAGAAPSFGNILPSVGGFGAGVPFAGVGGIGIAPAPLFGGGGLGNGGGNGSNAGNQSQTVNTNTSLQNQQSQTQTQSQTQSQSQSQTTTQKVVPEPGTVLLAALGLPVLLYLYRRRRRATLVVAAAGV